MGITICFHIRSQIKSTCKISFSTRHKYQLFLTKQPRISAINLSIFCKNTYRASINTVATGRKCHIPYICQHNTLLGNAITLIIGSMLLMTLLGLVFKTPILKAFGASDATIPYAVIISCRQHPIE